MTSAECQRKWVRLVAASDGSQNSGVLKTNRLGLESLVEAGVRKHVSVFNLPIEWFFFPPKFLFDIIHPVHGGLLGS